MSMESDFEKIKWERIIDETEDLKMLKEICTSFLHQNMALKDLLKQHMLPRIN